MVDSKYRFEEQTLINKFWKGCLTAVVGNKRYVYAHFNQI